MSSLAKQYYTPEEYLELEREAEYKSEYINGQIYAMSGASRQHNRIAFNLTTELGSQLKGQPCEGFGSDMRVKVSPTGMYTYPDITIVCGEPHFDEKQQDTLTNPTVIIEVLSPSTEAYDRGVKFAHYRELPSLTDYVLVSQDKVLVEHYTRSGSRDDQWLLTAISDPHSALPLTSIGCDINLRDIYDKVEFPSNEPTE